ncbi:HEAT repeat-containing protein 5B-like protein, partial [Corchorus olitorius]
GVIRASVTQDQSAAPTKSAAPTLEIKLPVPLEVRREENSNLRQQSEERDLPPSANPIITNNSDTEEDEDEDDWDTFQSFPASKSSAQGDSVVENVAREPDPDENSTSSSETTNVECSEVATEEIYDGSGDQGKVEPPESLSNPVTDPHENQDQEGKEELRSSTDSEAVASTETPHTEDSEGSGNAVEHQEEDFDNRVDAHSSSDTQPSEMLSSKETEEEADSDIDQSQHEENTSIVHESESQGNLKSPKNGDDDNADLESHDATV